MMHGHRCWTFFALLGAMGRDPDQGVKRILTDNVVPTATIAELPGGNTVLEGSTVTFSATVGGEDGDEDNAEELSVVWTVGGSTACEQTTSAAVGVVECTATLTGSDDEAVYISVTDQRGGVGEDALTVEIEANGAPTVDLTGTEPAADLVEGETFRVLGTVLDDHDDPSALTLGFTVTDAAGNETALDDLSPANSDGSWSESLTLDEGQHTLELVAVDSFGKVTTTHYLDADSDGYGDPASTFDACTLPSGYATLGTDCDDSQSDAFPGNTEVCDSIDKARPEA